MRAQRIFVFSGLGADERVFQNVDFGDFEPVHLPWIVPHRRETLLQYAKRLIEKHSLENHDTVIGLSFGGILAAEIANSHYSGRIIQISSAATRKELPFYFRLAGRLYLDKLVPTFMMTRPWMLTYWLFGAESKEDRALLSQILQGTDRRFLRWAVGKTIRWTANHRPQNLVKIHGDKDRVLPVRYVKTDYTLAGGGHFMILNRAPEISAILHTELEHNEKS